MKDDIQVAKLCMAERHICDPFSAKIYRRDSPSEVTFADGSKLVYDVLRDKWEVVKPSAEEIWAEKVSAYRRGRWDRLNRKPLDPNFKSECKKYLPCIADEYRKGWFSVADWPHRNFRR